MSDDGAVESYGLLADQRLGRTGMEVKLDRGFAEGRYAVYVQYDELADRVGFAAARRKAAEYLGLLKDQLGRLPGYSLGETVDESKIAGPGRKRDLESTFLFFAVETVDGRYHDDAMREDFRLTSLRAGREWDQIEAHSQAKRQDRRQREFRDRLAELLEGEAYADIDAATRGRLLDEIPALAFAAKERGL